MKKIIIGDAVERKEIIVDGATTLQKLLDDNNISYAMSGIFINGTTATTADFGKTISELIPGETGSIISAVKMQNA